MKKLSFVLLPLVLLAAACGGGGTDGGAQQPTVQSTPAVRDAHKTGRRQRPEPDGDFSPYLPPDDPIRLELESLFPPFATKAEDAAGKTAG